MRHIAFDKAALAARRGLAETAARAAGKALLAHYNARDRLNIEQKGVNDFVSNADREAEKIILDILQAEFPRDAYLGEETGFSGLEGSAAVWCIDPLDGTSNFLKGAHNWCVSIGLWSVDHPVLGVLYDPLRDEMFSAAEGLGATCNRSAISVSSTKMLDSAGLGIGHVARIPVSTFIDDTRKLLEAGAGFRQVGAGALMLAYVAAGRVDSYFERHMWPWDAMAGLALIREAGGVSNDYLRGKASVAEGDMVLAGGAALYPQIQQALGIG